MVKHTQTIRRQIADKCLSVLDHFVKLALKGLKKRRKVIEAQQLVDLPIKTN